MARDRDLQGLRVLLSEELVKWDETLVVKVRKGDPPEELVRRSRKSEAFLRFETCAKFAKFAKFDSARMR